MAEYTLAYAMGCLSTHFLFASVLGLLGYFLTWTICSKAWPEQATFRSPFWAGVFLALLSHWTIDEFTHLA